jgi:hypothetical protein
VTEDLILTELCGGLWHTTHPDRFDRILASGAIFPEPDIPNCDRWKTSQGEDYYPYVRTLGGVSLFDFDDFDPKSYSEKCPASSWHEFVPYRRDWGQSVWIEIDRKQVVSQFISGFDLTARWKSTDSYRHTIMPHIEAAHLGPLPRKAFARAFLVREGNSTFHSLAC